MTRRIIAVLSLAALAACGGGGGSVPSTPGNQGGSTVATPAPNPSTQPAQSTQLVLRFPAPGTSSSSAARAPKYVSQNAASIKVTVNSVNGSAPPSWATVSQTTALSTGAGGNCSIAGAVETCTITVPAPPGSVNYTFTLYDASTNVLAASTATFAIQQGRNTVLNVTLNGIVATLAVTGPTLTAGTAIAAPGTALTLTAKDASGATITGSDSYLNAYTLTDGDTSGATALSVNGGAPSSSVTVSAPSDVVTIVYSGLAINAFTITAASTVSAYPVTASLAYSQANANLVDAPIVFGGTTTGTSAYNVQPTDPNYNQPTLFFVSNGQTETFTAAETGWTNTPFSQTFTTDASGCTAEATVTPGALSGGAQTFSVTSTTTGICPVKLTDGVGQSSTVWISVSAATINLQ